MPRNTAFNIFNWCDNTSMPTYSKVVTFSNDPSISSKMRYSQLTRNPKGTHIIQYKTPPIISRNVPVYSLPAGQVRPFSRYNTVLNTMFPNP